MKKNLFFAIAINIVIISNAQEVIELTSKPASPDIALWQGGERTQKSPLDSLLTVSNVSIPTLTVYLPESGRATGTALIIAPGGGFHGLSIQIEGTDMADWCVENGITAFVLKYRLVPTGENPGQEFLEKLKKGQEQMDAEIAPYIDLAIVDGLTAIEYVRKNASKYNIESDKIGIIGFSAGGTVAAAAALTYTSKINRPDFFAPIYGAMHVLNLETLPENPVPLFMAVTGDDFFGFQTQSINLFETYNAAKKSVELHIYEKGQHGFGMRKQGLPSDEWISAFELWLKSHGFL